MRSLSLSLETDLRQASDLSDDGLPKRLKNEIYGCMGDDTAADKSSGGESGIDG